MVPCSTPASRRERPQRHSRPRWSPSRHPLVSTAPTGTPAIRRFVDAIDSEAEPAALAERLAALAADHERVCCLFDNDEMDDNAARPGELLEGGPWDRPGPGQPPVSDRRERWPADAAIFRRPSTVDAPALRPRANV
jgi:hypothetical protein